MANQNNSDVYISFVNRHKNFSEDDTPRLIVESGQFEHTDGTVISGVTFVTEGVLVPLLTAKEARKLSKWLDRAADQIDGIKSSASRKKRRHEYDEDDDDCYADRY